jgi:hypothetical protein
MQTGLHVAHRNCLLKQVTTEEKTEGEQELTGRQGRRRKQLMDDLKERRGYWNLKKGSTRSHSVVELGLEEAMDLSKDRVRDDDDGDNDDDGSDDDMIMMIMIMMIIMIIIIIMVLIMMVMMIIIIIMVMII